MNFQIVSFGIWRFCENVFFNEAYSIACWYGCLQRNKRWRCLINLTMFGRIHTIVVINTRICWSSIHRLISFHIDETTDCVVEFREEGRNTLCSFIFISTFINHLYYHFLMKHKAKYCFFFHQIDVGLAFMHTYCKWKWVKDVIKLWSELLNI